MSRSYRVSGAAFVAVMLLFMGQAAAADCKLVQITSLDAARDEAGGLTVPATIEGHDKPLLIDTAGIYSLLTESSVAEMKLSRRAMNSQLHMTLGADGHLLTAGAIAHSFKLGNIVADKMEFAIIPDNMIAHGASGTLGPSVMANYDMEIDPAHNKVNLYSQNHCPGEVVYWTRSPYAAIPMRLDSFLHIILPVNLDGHTFEALIDTGSSHSWLLYDLAKAPFGWSDDTKELTPATDAGAETGWYRYPFKSLSLNGVDIRNPRIDVHKGSGSAADRPTLVIGMDVLSKLRTFISYSEHMLYFTPANAPPPDEVERPMAATRAVPE
jgi:predicted aspartyl protease